MAVRAVHWEEGMFLRPHHFQAAGRFETHRSFLSDKWDLHYNWGLREVEIDATALANYRLVVRSLKARMRDGTLVASPEDGPLPEVDLKPVFEKEANPTVFLAVPIAHLGRANVAADAKADAARYLLDTQDLEDENTGLNPQPVRVRLLNLGLRLSTQDLAGYEVVPVARLRKAARADATPELDATYIPPVLACDGWKPLRDDFLQWLYDYLGKKIEQWTDAVVGKNITFDSQVQGDQEIFAILRVLNEAYTLFGVLSFAQGVHPLPAYMELCRLVGQLAIFGKARPPTLPRYDHDDLGTCFEAIKQRITELLDTIGRRPYIEEPFVGIGQRMEVSMQNDWLQPTWQMFIGVRSPLPSDQVINLLTRPGQFDMKIGSGQTVDEILKRRLRGLVFTYQERPPQLLPSGAGLTYFQVDRKSELDVWRAVQRELTLAIRLNVEKHVVGDFQGLRLLTVRPAQGQTTTMEFILYVVPPQNPVVS